MQLFLVSGLSGSGKTVALRTLEDMDYTCIDNLPVRLLRAYAEEELRGAGGSERKIAIGIDARAGEQDLKDIPALAELLRKEDIACRIIYLTADDDILIRRYNETRRKHPLAKSDGGIAGAVAAERTLLAPLADDADLVIDTSGMNVHELRQLLKERLRGSEKEELSLLFQSFGFKHGAPRDADFVFDVRALPNPYWEESLRGFTGSDPEIAEFLESHPLVGKMADDIEAFLANWLPRFEAADRDYLMIGIGCTGGRHRSVYIAERLGVRFARRYPNTTVRHSVLAEILGGEQLSLLQGAD